MGTTDRLNDLQDLPCPDTPVGGGTPARTWGADVVTVNADGTVDCQPVNSRATKVGVGVPSTYKATIGDRVIVTDLMGDPRMPMVIAPVSAAIGPAYGPPGTTGDSFGIEFQFVAQKNGNDSSDGLSWGSARATLDAAVAAMPDGGVVLVAPGSYYPASSLLLWSHHIWGMSNAAGVPHNSTVNVVCNFAGSPLIACPGPGQLSNLYLYSNNPATGDAIYCLGQPLASPSAAIASTGAVSSITGNSPCTGFSPSGHIAVDDEVFAYSAFSAGTFTITARNVGGTLAAAHTTGSEISQAAVLTASLGQGSITASVSSTAGLPAKGMLKVDQEYIVYTGTTANSFTGLRRGAFGTSPVAHSGGTAIRQFVSTPDGTSLDNVTVGGGFQNGLHIDGSNTNKAGGPGVRDITVSRGIWFGVRAGGQSVLLNRVVHFYASQLDLNPAGGALAGVQVLDNASEEIHFAPAYLNGNLESAAGGSMGDSSGPLVWEGHIAGNVTFDSGSKGNRIIGPILGTVTNNGDASNVTDNQPWLAPTLQNSWTNNGSGYQPAGYYRDPSGMIHLRGRMGSGTKTAGTVIFTLPSGFRPQGHEEFLCWAIDGNGSLKPCWVEVNHSTGEVSIQTDLSGTGTASLSLAGVQFSIN